MIYRRRSRGVVRTCFRVQCHHLYFGSRVRGLLLDLSLNPHINTSDRKLPINFPRKTSKRLARRLANAPRPGYSIEPYSPTGKTFLRRPRTGRGRGCFFPRQFCSAILSYTFHAPDIYIYICIHDNLLPTIIIKRFLFIPRCMGLYHNKSR